jgi:hypothetical protein
VPGRMISETPSLIHGKHHDYMSLRINVKVELGFSDQDRLALNMAIAISTRINTPNTA